MLTPEQKEYLENCPLGESRTVKTCGVTYTIDRRSPFVIDYAPVNQPPFVTLPYVPYVQPPTWPYGYEVICTHGTAGISPC